MQQQQKKHGQGEAPAYKEDKETDVECAETPIVANQVVKVNEQHISVLIKEFDLDRYSAIKVLRSNEGDLQNSIKYLVTN